MKIISVVGARPNFMKIAPFIRAIKNHNDQYDSKIKHLLVHTGQHYDDRMSKAFFQSLGIPKADINLGVGSGTHAEQVGRTMMAFEKTLLLQKPDWVVVVGDVNATLACSITAKKLHIKVCHIEAGLRSGDIRMPEEINRLVTDRLSDLLLIPDSLSYLNVKNEGVSDKNIAIVGNIMIDTLDANFEKSKTLSVDEIINQNKIEGQIEFLKLNNDGDFVGLTLHRPSNVDYKDILTSIFDFLTIDVATNYPIIWPIHPRTKKNLVKFGLWEKALNTERLILLHPLGYHEMMKITMTSKVMFTDSGGLQEECCVLGTPCLTMRWNTERPITLKKNGGLSMLVGNDINKMRLAFKEALTLGKHSKRPELWDGKTAERCLETILTYSK